jgi:antitoxin (DNA-binding transcriptional repressor) of toxin-antitoxin stability system
MCYMKALKRVGVRELRQNLSVHLARVIRGETLEVTDRGHAVAVLAPLPPAESVLDQLEQEGRLIRATGDLLDGLKPVKPPSPGWASRQLQRQRADRRL